MTASAPVWIGGAIVGLGVGGANIDTPPVRTQAGEICMTATGKFCVTGDIMELIASGRGDLRSLVTHRFRLDQVEAACDLFAHQRDGVLNVAITP